MTTSLSDEAMRAIKGKLKRGPKFSRRELAAYAFGLMEATGRKFHHPLHAGKPGEPSCRAQIVPKLIVELLEAIPHEAVAAACDTLGHPSFWLGPGYRCQCVCGDVSYKD